MSTGTITTEAELAALPERTAVVDRMGDVGTVLGGLLRYPETSPQTFERAAKKYGPFHIVYSPPVPEIAPGITGKATLTLEVPELVERDVPGTWVKDSGIKGLAFVTHRPVDGSNMFRYDVVSDFVPDGAAPTLAQVVDVICAWDPENGGHEPGAQTHSHDPADGECYWAMTVGPNLAPLWTNGGAS